MDYISNFGTYKRHIIAAAKQLFYPSEVIEALKMAKSEQECTLIMRTARERSFAAKTQTGGGKMFILEFKTDSTDFTNIYSGKSDELRKMFVTFRVIRRVISAIWGGNRSGEVTDREGNYIGRWEFN